MCLGVHFRVDGSALGFVPIVICGLTTHYPNASHGLWIRSETTVNPTWVRLDQKSQYESDYWQTNYVRDTDDYEIVFNVELLEHQTYISFGPEPSHTSLPSETSTPIQQGLCASILETFENTQCCNPTDFVQNIQCANIKQDFENNDCSHICAAHGERRKRKKRVFRWTYPPKQES